MKSLFLVLLLSFPVLAQDFNIDNFTPITEEVVEVLNEPSLAPELDVIAPELESIIDLDDAFENESKDRIEEMKKIAEEIKKIADEIKASQVVKMTFEDSFETRLKNLEDKSLTFLTKEQVEEIVKVEVEKVVKVTMKLGNITIEKEVPLNMTEKAVVYNSVNIPGYSGSFTVPEGAYISHVDGVPVTRSRLLNGRLMNYSNGYLMQSSSNKVNISSCQMVNGVRICN